MIRIRKLPPSETPDFPRRWVVSREPEGDGVADHILGYFSSQQEAIQEIDRPLMIMGVLP